MPDEDKDFDAAFDEMAGKTPDPDEIKGDEPPEPPAETITEDDPYLGLSPEAKERVVALEKDKADLEHRIESDEGRVRSYQSKYEESQAALAAAGKAQPSEAEVSAAMKTPEQWDDFKTEYPEVSGAIESYMDSRVEQIQTDVDGKIQPLAASVAHTATVESETSLEETYPKWQDHVATEEFGAWIGTQASAVQGLAASDKTNDAAALLDLYNTNLVASGKDPIKTPVASGGRSNEADDLAAKRKQQLEDAETIRSTGSGIDPGEAAGGTEFENNFAFYAAKSAKKA